MVDGFKQTNQPSGKLEELFLNWNIMMLER
jgi:hypothetical protein